MRNSMKVMWACLALLVLLAIVSIASANAGYLLFAVPCMIMMGAMVWMMMGGMSRGSRGGDRK